MRMKQIFFRGRYSAPRPLPPRELAAKAVNKKKTHTKIQLPRHNTNILTE